MPTCPLTFYNKIAPMSAMKQAVKAHDKHTSKTTSQITNKQTQSHQRQWHINENLFGWWNADKVNITKMLMDKQWAWAWCMDNTKRRARQAGGRVSNWQKWIFGGLQWCSAWMDWRFWIRSPAVSNRIRSKVFLPVARTSLDLDFAFTEKALYIGCLLDLYFLENCPHHSNS